MKETFTSPWPKEWQTLAAFKPIDAVPLSPYANIFFPLAVKEFDQILETKGIETGMLAWQNSEFNVREQINVIADVGVQIIQNNGRVVLPLFGTLDILERITERMKESGAVNWEQHIDAKKVSRTNGTELGEVSMKGSFGRVDPRVQNMLADDLIDGVETSRTILSQLTDVPVKHLLTPEQMITTMERNNLLFGVFANKNEEFWNKLLSEVENGTTDWHKKQLSLMKQVTHAPGVWLMGMRLDTTIVGSTFHIPEQENNPLTRDIQHVELSLGRNIRGLVGLKNPEAFQEVATQFFQDKIARFDMKH